MNYIMYIKCHCDAMNVINVTFVSKATQFAYSPIDCELPSTSIDNIIKALIDVLIIVCVAFRLLLLFVYYYY